MASVMATNIDNVSDNLVSYSDGKIVETSIKTTSSQPNQSMVPPTSCYGRYYQHLPHSPVCNTQYSPALYNSTWEAGVYPNRQTNNSQGHYLQFQDGGYPFSSLWNNPDEGLSVPDVYNFYTAEKPDDVVQNDLMSDKRYDENGKQGSSYDNQTGDDILNSAYVGCVLGNQTDSKEHTYGESVTRDVNINEKYQRSDTSSCSMLTSEVHTEYFDTHLYSGSTLNMEDLYTTMNIDNQLEFEHSEVKLIVDSIPSVTEDKGYYENLFVAQVDSNNVSLSYDSQYIDSSINTQSNNTSPNESLNTSNSSMLKETEESLDSSQSSNGGDAKKRRCITPRNEIARFISSFNPLALRIMSNWYDRNKSHPYPSKDTCQVMAKAGGLSVAQVKKWFANRRRREQNTRSLTQIAKERRQFKRPLAVTGDVVQAVKRQCVYSTTNCAY